VDIKEYLKENFFIPLFTNGKPNKSKKHYHNIFSYKGEFASKERDEFFDGAYGEILFDLFLRWVQSPVEDQEMREHMYRQALALGSVKEKMINYETYGKNAKFLGLEEEEEDNDEQPES